MGRPSAVDRGEKYILALDVGTSSIHCLLADSTGFPVATASAPMSYFTPQGCPSLAKEFEPGVVFDSVGQLIGQVMQGQGLRASCISAIGITSQRQGVVFLDEMGEEIYCGPNVDLRAVFEGATIDEELGAEIYATTGHFPSLLLAPARLRWVRQNHPQVYERTGAILPMAGWLSYKLTGTMVSEPSLEGEIGLLDITTRERTPVLMEKLGITPSMLPPLSRGGLPIGPLSPSVADLWELEREIPVVVAGPDTQCGLLGMGLGTEGQVGVVLGWSGALQVITSRPYLDERMRTWAGCCPAADLWVAESNLGDAGNAYRWLKDTLQGGSTSFEEADRLAEASSAACEGVVAYLGPGPMSAFKAGFRMGGLLFPSPVSFQETTRGQLFRAALESIAYSVKANLATLHEVTGLDAQVLYLGGGMSRSWTLASTLATVLGMPVMRSTIPQVSARGAALSAAAATDPSLTLVQVTEAAARDCEAVEPGAASDVAQHQEYYQRWLNLYNCLEWE